jgi:hypothetical protein
MVTTDIQPGEPPQSFSKIKKLKEKKYKLYFVSRLFWSEIASSRVTLLFTEKRIKNSIDTHKIIEVYHFYINTKNEKQKTSQV